MFFQTCAKTGSSYEVKTSDPSGSGSGSSSLDQVENTTTTESSKVEGVEEEVSRPVSASGLCRRLQLIEVRAFLIDVLLLGCYTRFSFISYKIIFAVGSINNSPHPLFMKTNL